MFLTAGGEVKKECLLMEENKICPLFMIAAEIDSYCEGPRCAWWVAGAGCAVTTLADTLADAGGGLTHGG